MDDTVASEDTRDVVSDESRERTDDVLDDDLVQRAWKLLQPGEIELDGIVVTTEFTNDQEPEMHQLTVEIGETTDDSEFASNQHQGLTLDDESFVWECQQLYRDGTFDIVFYFEASIDTDGLLSSLEEHDVAYVRGDADSPNTAALSQSR